jgi:hypothetical protein
VKSIVKSFARRARQLVRDGRAAGSLARGAMHFSRTGDTPSEAYQSLIHLYCRTQGWSNDVLHAVVRKRHPPASLPPADGVLGRLSPGEIARMSEQIRTDGYFRFEGLLPPDVCDRLLDFAQRSEALISPPRADCPPRAVFDAARPIAESYRFEESAMLQDRDIQSLISDATLIALAQAYLGCVPVLSTIAMWWSTSAVFSDSARSELAQMYHFDMDRIKWLKFFFYLTDVSPEAGPHCYIAGSHRTGRQPAELLDRGYVRIRDEELQAYYGPEERIEITGPRGTMFVADTRGFHKGLTPRGRDRLLLQIEFCDTLFGAAYNRPVFPRECLPVLAERRRSLPRLYSRYL